ncbi:hypothetical protein ACP70R_046276 [Stipagrostis hirtigluma subsp. patula]
MVIGAVPPWRPSAWAAPDQGLPCTQGRCSPRPSSIRRMDRVRSQVDVHDEG